MRPEDVQLQFSGALPARQRFARLPRCVRPFNGAAAKFIFEAQMQFYATRVIGMLGVKADRVAIVRALAMGAATVC